MNLSELSSPPVLEMIDVAISSMQAPDSPVLDHVNWTVAAGDSWVVSGAPGSGKSDLLTTAAGLMRPLRGVHRLLGQEVAHLHEEERLRIQLHVGVVFGYGGRLFSHLTVAENLSLPICYHENCSPAHGGTRALEVLAALDLTHVADKKPQAIDRALQQRTALGRALVLSPEVLFLDNPVVGVGARELRWWRHILEELRRGHALLQGRRLTIVIGTNDLQPWDRHQHQFALTHGGRFWVIGGREQLVRQTDPELRELLPADWLSA